MIRSIPASPDGAVRCTVPARPYPMRPSRRTANCSNRVGVNAKAAARTSFSGAALLMSCARSASSLAFRCRRPRLSPGSVGRRRGNEGGRDPFAGTASRSIGNSTKKAWSLRAPRARRRSAHAVAARQQLAPKPRPGATDAAAELAPAIARSLLVTSDSDPDYTLDCEEPVLPTFISHRGGVDAAADHCYRITDDLVDQPDSDGDRRDKSTEPRESTGISHYSALHP